MNGLIALVGSGEYLPVMNDVDRYLLASLNVKTPHVVCLPTAAGQEGDDTINRWIRMGVDHFQKLGAEAQALRIIDKASADDAQYVPALESADLIYFSGGNPQYLYETLQGTRAWDAMQKAWGAGAVYAGCSAGAMILGREVPDFRMAGLRSIKAFAAVPARYIMPHFDAIPSVWKPFILMLRKRLRKGERMIGIDENTALVGTLNPARFSEKSNEASGVNGEWKVMGQGKVQVFTRAGGEAYENGQSLSLT